MEILLEADARDTIKEKEIEFITLYGRRDNKSGILVNKTGGGDGRLDADHESMKSVIQYLKQQIGGKHRGAKKIYQYDLAGKFIQEFECLRYAAKSVGLKSDTGITNCCTGISKSSKGFRWFYKFMGITIEPLTKEMYKEAFQRGGDKRGKKVGKFDKNTKTFIEEFKSTMEAQRQTGISNTHISACCLGKQPSAGGFYWNYL